MVASRAFFCVLYLGTGEFRKDFLKVPISKLGTPFDFQPGAGGSRAPDGPPEAGRRMRGHMAQQTFTGRKRVRKFFGQIKEVAEMPNLIEVQKASYDQFLMVAGAGGRAAG